MLTATLFLLGAVLLAMSLAERAVKRLPLSPAIVYLAVGCAVGALAQPLTVGDLVRHAPAFTVVTEGAVLVSLFIVGLRLRVPSTWKAWRVAATLASAGMLVTVALGAAFGAWLLALSLPAAVLLAAILAPTDPVLASEVQIQAEDNRDAVRLSLTAEGGLNDGTALPIVMLALGLLGLHALGPYGGRWLAVDLLWSVGGGLLLGWALGRALGRALEALLRREHRLEWDELLCLGTIALAYGLARLTHTSAFLLVFATALALFHRSPLRTAAADPGALMQRLIAFGERCERLIEVSMVLAVGAMLAWVELDATIALFALLFVFVVRPLSVYLVVRRSALPVTQRRLVAWFGIRGVGSLFYLAFALDRGLAPALTSPVVSACLWTIALSIVVHGVSATPLMTWYLARRGQRRRV